MTACGGEARRACAALQRQQQYSHLPRLNAPSPRRRLGPRVCRLRRPLTRNGFVLGGCWLLAASAARRHQWRRQWRQRRLSRRSDAGGLSALVIVTVGPPQRGGSEHASHTMQEAPLITPKGPQDRSALSTCSRPFHRTPLQALCSVRFGCPVSSHLSTPSAQTRGLPARAPACQCWGGMWRACTSCAVTAVTSPGAQCPGALAGRDSCHAR